MSFFEPPGGWGDVYDSYTTDPLYRSRMLAGLAGLLGVCTLLAAPIAASYVLRSRRLAGCGSFLSERWSSTRSRYGPRRQGRASPSDKIPSQRWTRQWSAGRPLSPIMRGVTVIQAVFHSLTAYSLPLSRGGKNRRQSYMRLTTGQLSLIVCVACIVLACILPEQQLLTNANRLGFLALGLIPTSFLLAMKSFSPLALLLGKSYEKLNFLHRWVGRMLLVIILAHMSLWTSTWIPSGTAYTLSMLQMPMQVYGFLGLAFLLLLAVTSIRPIREYSYTIFFCLHVVGFVGLIVAVNYHTTYAYSWTGYAVCAIYGADLIGRFCHWRFKEIILEALRDEQGADASMTKITVNDLTFGWRAGQHVQLRIFFSPPSSTSSTSHARVWYNPMSCMLGINHFRSFESHPFTIAQAPPSISVLPQHAEGRGVRLYARVVAPDGLHISPRRTWSSDLNCYTQAVESVLSRRKSLIKALQTERSADGSRSDGQNEELQALITHAAATQNSQVTATAMLEGPYGGMGYSQIDTSETVLLVACGSGMSFTLACLDEIVGRTIRGHRGARTRVVEVVWVVRHASCLSWFSETLLALQRAADESGLLCIKISAYVTCTSYDAPSSPHCACNDYRQGTTAPRGCCCVEPLPANSNLLRSNQANVGSSSPPAYSRMAPVDGSSEGIRVRYERPHLPAILRQTIKDAVNPCSTCIDCRCATFGNGDGTCAGACGATCQMPPEADLGRIGGRVSQDEIQIIPALDQLEVLHEQTQDTCCGKKEKVVEKVKGGCCGQKVAANVVVSEKSASCCGNKRASTTISCCTGANASSGCACASASNTQTGCGCASASQMLQTSACGCRTASLHSSTASSGTSQENEKSPSLPGQAAYQGTISEYPPKPRQAGEPAEIRTGGLAVAACGPGNMLAELGNAVANVELSLKLKIGGISWVREGFEV